jgi:hypothetical protein
VKKRSLPTNRLLTCACVAVALWAPFGCGNSDDDDDAKASGGSGGAAAGMGGRGGSGGSMNRAGTAGRNAQGTSGSGPTGCEGSMPKNGAACTDRGIVCPSALGSCVCERQGWECFEIGVGDGGSGNLPQGGTGPDFGGAPPDLGGAGGAELGGQAGAFSVDGGTAGAAGAAGGQ